MQWLPESVKQQIRRLDVKNRKCEDYRTIANVLGVPQNEVELLAKNLPDADGEKSITLVLLKKWSSCVTIRALYTVLELMGLVDKDRAEILDHVDKLMKNNGHTVS